MTNRPSRQSMMPASGRTLSTRLPIAPSPGEPATGDVIDRFLHRLRQRAKMEEAIRFEYAGRPSP